MWKFLAPCLLLYACSKDDIEVKYSVTCDKCVIEYHVGGNRYFSQTVDSHRWTTGNPPVKILDTFITGATVKEDEPATLIMYRDSGYAFIVVDRGPDTKSVRVYGDMELVSLH